MEKITHSNALTVLRDYGCIRLLNNTCAAFSLNKPLFLHKRCKRVFVKLLKQILRREQLKYIHVILPPVAEKYRLYSLFAALLFRLIKLPFLKISVNIAAT